MPSIMLFPRLYTFPGNSFMFLTIASDIFTAISLPLFTISLAQRLIPSSVSDKNLPIFPGKSLKKLTTLFKKFRPVSSAFLPVSVPQSFTFFIVFVSHWPIFLGSFANQSLIPFMIFGISTVTNLHAFFPNWISPSITFLKNLTIEPSAKPSQYPILSGKFERKLINPFHISAPHDAVFWHKSENQFFILSQIPPSHSPIFSQMPISFRVLTSATGHEIIQRSISCQCSLKNVVMLFQIPPSHSPIFSQTPISFRVLTSATGHETIQRSISCQCSLKNLVKAFQKLVAHS